MAVRRFLSVAGLLAVPSAAWFSQSQDWLVSSQSPKPTTFSVSENGLSAVLSNGLVSRSFSINPCFTTTDLTRDDISRTYFRTLSSEASMTLNGAQVDVGVCMNGDPLALPQFWTPSQAVLYQDPLLPTFQNISTQPPSAPFPWVPGTWHTPTNIPWPPLGLHVTATFKVGSLMASNVSTTFSAFAGYDVPCSQGTCITGWQSCDNSSVPNECTWPASKAVAECTAWPECFGVRCAANRTDCQARGFPSSLQPTAGVTTRVRTKPHPAAGSIVHVNYEMYDGLPLIRKWIGVETGTDKGAVSSILVDAVINEQLRAPNWAPEQITVVQLEPYNPAPATQQVVPEPTQSFPGRTQQYWFFDPDWDACCDAELHVTYTYYTYLRVGYENDTTFGGSTGPGALVTANSSWSGISTRLVLHDTADLDRQGVGMRKIQAVLAPQLLETPLEFMLEDISSTEAFRLSLDQCAEAGIELALVAYGAAGYCGMCPDQVQNATWVAWFAEQVAYANSIGVQVSAYTLMQHNGWGETVPEAEQVLNRDGTRGGIACFATDWHAAYRQSVLDFAKAVGLAGIETDGQYEGAACADDSGDHHHNGLAGAWDVQMAATQNFNSELKAHGLYQTGADAYYFSGANRWNHADTDAGYDLQFLFDRLNVGRDYIYDSTSSRLHSSGGYLLGDLINLASQCDPTPGRLVCLDFALASFLGQGVAANVIADKLWDPADPDAARIGAIFKVWSNFFAAHRPIFISHAVAHLAKPTTRSYEATAFLTANTTSTERAFVAVYNPTPSVQQGTLQVPLYYSNLAPYTTVSIWQVQPNSTHPIFLRNATIGNDGGAIFDISISISLQPVSYAFYSIQPAA